MENFNKLVPIDGENGEKRTISSLQIAEVTGKAYCGVLKVIRKMDIMRVKITMKNIFSLFVCLKKCCTFVVLQLTIKYANGIFYARKETYILKREKFLLLPMKKDFIFFLSLNYQMKEIPRLVYQTNFDILIADNDNMFQNL